MDTKYKLFVILIAISGLQISLQISLPEDPTYNAGVVEFIPSTETNSKQRVTDNQKRLKEIIESKETRDLDILVFPEMVVNNKDWPTYVPDPALKIAPCDVADYHIFLSEISCAARSRKLYVVINVVEKEVCLNQKSTGAKTCHSSGINSYNTNVVFDREGRVISRYRKTHLYRGEWNWINTMEKPMLATFETDFGVTFGHFICFDMLFYEPAQVLIREKNISDIIYPTYWFNELPFLTAVQLQEGWAYANDVNLLAADASNPMGQNTGSGIYAGKLGRLAACIHETPTTKLLTAKLPKREHRASFVLPPVVRPIFTPQVNTPRFTKLNLLRDYNVDIFTTKLLDAEFLNVEESLCHNDFCCKFKMQRTQNTADTAYSAYRYRLVAYSGDQTTFQRVDPSELSVCALITCTNDQLYSCGHIFPENVLVGNKFYFNSLNVSGIFRKTDRRLIMPSTVDAQMMPLSAYEMFQTESSNASTIVAIGLTERSLNLLTFGIYTNYYSRKEVTHNLDAANLKNEASSKISARFLPAAILLTILILHSF